MWLRCGRAGQRVGVGGRGERGAARARTGPLGDVKVEERLDRHDHAEVGAQLAQRLRGVRLRAAPPVAARAPLPADVAPAVGVYERRAGEHLWARRKRGSSRRPSAPNGP